MPDGEIQSYMKLAGLQWPIRNYLVRAHYDMEDLKGSVLLDRSGNNFHGNLFGKPDLIPVSVPLHLTVFSRELKVGVT